MNEHSERSKVRITKSDLKRLADLALDDLKSLFSRKKETGHLYQDRLFAIALCQGAALHYVDGKNGVKDFDVWCFFRANPARPFPYRRNGTADFGSAKFGKSPGWEHLFGRRVDFLGRSLDVPTAVDPVLALRSYLSDGKTESARQLAAKAMVLIWPTEKLGMVVWGAQNELA